MTVAEINKTEINKTENIENQELMSAENMSAELTGIQKLELWLRGAVREQYEDESGMSTIEYALGCVAAAALGALLYMVVTSDTVENALSGIFERALNEGN